MEKFTYIIMKMENDNQLFDQNNKITKYQQYIKNHITLETYIIKKIKK